MHEEGKGNCACVGQIRIFSIFRKYLYYSGRQ